MRFFTDKKQQFTVLILLSILFTSFFHLDIIILADETEPENVPWPTAPSIYGASAILIDADSGAVLYANNVHERLYPASITKIMTGLLSIENLSMNDTITYTDDVLNSLPGDASKLGLMSGETTTIHDALYALFLRSANDAAVGLAKKISGSEQAFGELMTERARQIGALDTNFVNSTGLHDDMHYTTAYDMALITRAAMSNSEFSAIWGCQNYTLAATNLSESYRIWHTHSLIVSTSNYYYPAAIGGKTGYTDEAGRTLVTAAQKNGLKLISVIMKSDNEHIFSDTASLLDYGFQNFTRVNIKESETRFGTDSSGIPVIKQLYGSNAKIFSLSGDTILIPASLSLSEIPYTIEFLETPDNNIVASITYEYQGNYLGKASLMMNLSNSSEIPLSKPQKAANQSGISSSIKETASINIYILAGIIISCLVVGFILFKILRFKHKMAQMKKRRTYK